MTREETRRYSRQMLLPEVGAEGQERLRKARVLVVGVGGLGSPAAMYLAAAGVGTLGLVDYDTVDETNLHRQPLHGTKDIGRSKLESAAETLRDLNPSLNLELHESRLSVDNAMEIVAAYDIVADGTDNFPTRYLVNDACVLLGKPNVYASIYRFDGQLSVFDAKSGPCYRCLFPEPPPAGAVPSCAEAGVLGALPGVAGSLQATEVLKLILERGQSMVGRFLVFDLLSLRFEELKIEKDPNCPICSDQPTIKELQEVQQACLIVPEISSDELRDRLANEGAPKLLDVREPDEVEEDAIQGHTHIPLGDLPERLHELDASAEWVVYCHSGGRSAKASEMLLSQGIARVRNLKGGIEEFRRTEADRGKLSTP